MTKPRFPAFKSILSFLVPGLALAALAACTVRTPVTETPVPTDRGIEKSFFVESKTVVKQGKAVTEMKPKTFLCGWAPIVESGELSSSFLMHAVHMSNHCNMQFEITENALIGRLVNPTFPKEPARWKVALKIPIRKHYYYEKAKDSYGRETNEFVENDQRSHFSARPMINVGLEHVSINDWEIGIFPTWAGPGAGQIHSIQDVEWDKENGFLGFTATIQGSGWFDDVGARVRFNFKSFEHNEKFEITPFSPLNAKYFNALHVMGEKVEGLSQIWAAAKWDLSKTHDIYTYGFTDEYMPIAEKVIEQWNDAFKAIGKPAAFRLNKTKMKYPYDLRYPMMVWVEDSQISAYSPLGVGMAQADVLNGEMLWGQVTLYGGMLERYVKAHLGPVGASASANAKSSLDVSQLPTFFQTYFNPTKPMRTMPPLNPASLERLEARVQALATKPSSEEIARRLGMSLRSGEKPTGEQREAITSQLENEQRQQLETIRQNLRQNFAETNGLLSASRERSESVRLDTKQLYGFSGGASEAARLQAFGKGESSMSIKEKIARFSTDSAESLERASGAVVFDANRRLIDIGPGILAGLAKHGVSYEEGLRKVIHELMLHEVGHMLGLGHQFKENILPEEGAVPAKYITELKKGVAKNWTNSTSVMGYKHPITEIIEDEESIAPGPQDLLTLRYLYNREYATFRRGSTDDEFSFAKVPASGVIPSVNPANPEQATSYFPQCNDFNATFGTDPYCNRFDRGNDAATIVKNYFDDMNANMVSKIFAFTDFRGGNTDQAEAALWWRSLTTFGRVRTFYDHMRQKFANEILQISNSRRDLYEFSRVCTGEMRGSALLESVFARSPELKELCRVNRMAVREMTNLLTIPGPDRSRMDWDNANIAGGLTGGDADTDWSRVWGTHTALSVLPIKISAMNALTTPYPYTMLGPWMFPIIRYSGSDGLFSYSTLYPIEFTEASASSVEKNLKFSSFSNSGTMGASILSLGYFLDQQSYGNDSTRVPRDYTENIRNQTNFRISFKAVILSMKTREDKSRVTHFEAELYDPDTNRSQRIPEAFLLPGGKLVVRAASRNFVAPFTKIMFLADDVAFAWAYHIEYDKQDEDDILVTYSAKSRLEKLNNSLLDSCIRGNKDGLASYFNAQSDPAKYPGFFVMSGIANDAGKQLRFFESVRDNFVKYIDATKVKTGEGVVPERCEKAVNGVGLLVSTAAVLNGYFLSDVLDYWVK